MSEEHPLITETLARFADLDACVAFLVDLRWPDGFVCECGEGGYHLDCRARVFQCKACDRQKSVTAGTIFHRARDLQMWLVCCSCLADDEINAAQLARALEARHPTVWEICQKLRRAFDVERGELSGEVAVTIRPLDEASRPWPVVEVAPGGKHDGRCVIAAKETREGGALRLAAVPAGRSRREAVRKAVGWFRRGTSVLVALAPEADLRAAGLVPVVVGPGDQHRLRQVRDAAHALHRWIAGLFGNVSGGWLHRYLDQYQALLDGGFRFERLVSRALALPHEAIVPRNAVYGRRRPMAA